MMIGSAKPRKQRLFRFSTAAMHQRQHFVHSHLDKSVRAKLGIKRRAVQISKGDTVKVMSGKSKGKTGKVTKVDLRTGRISIDALMKKNSRGKEFNIPISANNVYIVELNLTDKYRADKLKVARQEKKAQVLEARKIETPEGKTEMVFDNKTQQYVKHKVQEEVAPVEA